MFDVITYRFSILFQELESEKSVVVARLSKFQELVGLESNHLHGIIQNIEKDFFCRANKSIENAAKTLLDRKTNCEKLKANIQVNSQVYFHSKYL